MYFIVRCEHPSKSGKIGRNRTRLRIKSIRHNVECIPEIKVGTDAAFAERIAAFRADKDMLKRVYSPLCRGPRQWLVLVHGSSAWRARSWRLIGSIAAVIVPMAIGAIACRELRPMDKGEIAQAALDARARIVSVERTIEIARGENTDQYSIILSAAVAAHVDVPDMGKLGYRLEGIRLYRRSTGGGAAELLYRDSRGRLFTVYVQRAEGTTRFDQFGRSNLRVCVWQDGELGAVMIGDVSTPAMQRLASLAYTGLTL